jgi:hypothetical protein
VIEDFQSNVNTTAGVFLFHANHATVSNFKAFQNRLAGVLLDRSNNNNINDMFIDQNVYGDFLVSSSNNQINDSSTDNNSVAGEGLGCPNRTVYADCEYPQPSNGNQLYASQNIENGSFGIEIQSGNHNNIVADTTNGGNRMTDLVDHNPDCDNDHWFANSFGTANPSSCIH